MLLYIPDFVYGIVLPEIYDVLAKMKIVPCNTSGLLSTVFMITLQRRFVKLNSSAKKLGDLQVKMSQEIKEIANRMDTGQKQLRDCLKNLINSRNDLDELRSIIDTLEIVDDKRISINS